MKVNNLGKLVERLKKKKHIDVNVRMEVLDELLEMEEEIQEAVQLLHDLPDNPKEDNSPDIEKKVKKNSRRIGKLEDKFETPAPKKKK